MAETSGPTETLPDPAPFFVFFLPNFWGVLLAVAFEYVDLEDKIVTLLPAGSHPCALLGFALFVLANTASYMTGCVVLARIEYDVKLPNLYADKRENKNAVQFNCVQRGHQNFIENLPQAVRN
jgi:MAPEG family